jgi:hypothetical protein
MVDVGVGVGTYWISSRGFDTVNGLILQPIRADFHAPTAWVNSGGLKRFAAAFTLRAGVQMFPAGFDANAFAGVGAKAMAIDGKDLVPTATLFVNLEPLILRRTQKLFLR